MIAVHHAIQRANERLEVAPEIAEEVLCYLWLEGWHASLPDLRHFGFYRGPGRVCRVAVWEGEWVLIVRDRCDGKFITVIKATDDR